MDQIEELIECQKVFMEVVSDIRSENMFTFPVITTSLYYTSDELNKAKRVVGESTLNKADAELRKLYEEEMKKCQEKNDTSEQMV